MAIPRLGSVTTAEGWTYKFTPEDWLWAARMLSGEVISPRGGWGAEQVKEGEAILWTMLNYSYQTRNINVGRHEAATRPPRSFAALIRAYSQPINPCWARGGGCSSGSTEEQYQHRAHITSLTPDKIDPLILTTVTRFMQGKVPGAPYAGLVHFAAKFVSYRDDPTHVGPQTVTGLGGRSNVFYKSNVSVNWPPNLFKFQFSSTAVIAAGLTLLGIGAGVGYYFWAKARQHRTAAFGNVRTARLRAGKLHCPYCQGEVQCEMPPQLCGPDDAAPLLFNLIGADKRVEGFWVFLLDSRMRVIGKRRLALGTTVQVLADPQAVFATALKSKKPVSAIITVHNHTADDSTPSQPDLDTTHATVTVGQFLHIPLIDHIVVGSTGEYTSIRDYVEQRYGEDAFARTVIVPGGVAARRALTQKEDVKGLFGADI